MSDVLVSVGRVAASAVAPGWGPLLYDTAQNLISGPGTQQVGSRLTELQLMRSSEGATIARVFGTARVGGHLIWADSVREHSYVTGGGKGTRAKSRRQFSYTLTFAVALCEGPIKGVGRIWADGVVLNSSDYEWRVHLGTETQEIDTRIASEERGRAPAYRGLAYVVFDDFNFTRFGNRIPQLNFEVFRAEDNLANEIQAMALLPGGEFAHDTQLQVVQARPGGPKQNYADNAHVESGASDWTLALDNMQAQCPQCAWVALRVHWFGDDLRLSHCRLQPRVETRAKTTLPAESQWKVAGLTRATASIVPLDPQGRPLFVGTPSDASLRRAIVDLKARGLKIMFYPDIVMDAPKSAAQDPHGRTAPLRFAWRGDVTCNPAPGRPGTVDKSAAGEAQLRRFVTGRDAKNVRINAWSLETMIVHYAKLCAAAGGVDAFLLGSQLLGASRVRNAAGGYPFATHLVALGQLVRTHLPTAQLSYAAHPNEYSAYRPPNEPTTMRFPLDEFWGDAQTAFVGLDAFFPLSDWREEERHADADLAPGPHDFAYLRSNVAGGEGYDWVYADEEARRTQTRTPAEIGVPRNVLPLFSFLVNWWYLDHFDDFGTEVQGLSTRIIPPEVLRRQTAWRAKSKPIWLTSLGCPAVDKGSNQPDAVPHRGNPGLRPRYSNGQRDDFIQRQYLRAFISYWKELQDDYLFVFDPTYDWIFETPEGRRITYPRPPPQSIPKPYTRDILPISKFFVLGWDVRPFPAFPNLTQAWPDALDWRTGYALNGRLSQAQLSDMLSQLSHGEIRGAQSERVSANGDDRLPGYLIDHAESPVGALRPLLRAFFLETVPDGTGFRAIYRGHLPIKKVEAQDILIDGDSSGMEVQYADAASLPTALKLFYFNYELDCAPGMVEARMERNPYRTVQMEWPLVLRPQQARQIADKLLQEIRAARETLRLSLPPTYMALDVGDVMQLEDKFWRILRITDRGALEVEAVRHLPQIYEREPTAARVQRQLEVKSADPAAMDAAADDAPPPEGGDEGAVRLSGPLQLHVLDLPQLGFGPAGMPLVAAASNPWPQDAMIAPVPPIWATALGAPTPMGETASPLERGPSGRWDYAARLEVSMRHGELESRPMADVLGGENCLAVRTPDGWEVLQFVYAELIAPQLYRLTSLLRGQYGSDAVMAETLPPGAPAVLLQPSLTPLAQNMEQLREHMLLRYGEGAHEDSARFWTELRFQPARVGLKPLAPVHARAAPLANGDVRISWIRRSRAHGDYWDAAVPLGEAREAYQLTVWRGAARVRTVRVGAPTWLYPRAELAADLGTAPALEVEIAQIGDAGQPGYSVRVRFVPRP